MSATLGLDSEPRIVENSSVLKLLECPVCFNYMGAPLYQCDHGHLICTDCLPNLAACPICRVDLDLDNCQRNLMAEQLSGILLFPCKNNEQGCNKNLKFNDVAKHSTVCPYRTYNCLVMPTCNWQGRRSEIYAHVSTEHEQKAWNTPLGILKCPEGFGTTSFETKSIIQAYDEIFLIIMLLDQRGILFGYVTYIGEEEGASHFRYSFVFHNNFTKIKHQAVTQPEKNDLQYIFNHGSCFSIDAKLADGFKVDNALQFGVEITKV